jgi:hypothetical protein
MAPIASVSKGKFSKFRHAHGDLEDSSSFTAYIGPVSVQWLRAEAFVTLTAGKQNVPRHNDNIYQAKPMTIIAQPS